MAENKIKILVTTLIVLSFLSCKWIYSVNQNRAKVILHKNIDSDKKIVVKYNYNECKNFNIFVYKNELFINKYEIRVCSLFAIIEKSPKKNDNFIYSLVTDTFQNHFKCFDYNFLKKYCNSEIKKTFEPISNEELIIFKKVSDFISMKYGFSFTNSDVLKMKGWIKLEN